MTEDLHQGAGMCLIVVLYYIYRIPLPCRNTITMGKASLWKFLGLSAVEWKILRMSLYHLAQGMLFPPIGGFPLFWGDFWTPECLKSAHKPYKVNPKRPFQPHSLITRMNLVAINVVNLCRVSFLTDPWLSILVVTTEGTTLQEKDPDFSCSRVQNQKKTARQIALTQVRRQIHRVSLNKVSILFHEPGHTKTRPKILCCWLTKMGR